MELFQLRYFVAAGRKLNFSRAAESLYVSQPSLSQQIARLESELGTSLFHRTGRRVRLTQAGQALLPLAERLLAGEEEARRTVEEVAGLRRGRLTLYALPALEQHARVTGTNHFGDPADARRHDRATGSHARQDGQRNPLLVRGVDLDVRQRKQFGKVGTKAKKPALRRHAKRFGKILNARVLGPHTWHPQLDPWCPLEQAFERVEQHVVTFLRPKAGDLDQHGVGVVDTHRLSSRCALTGGEGGDTIGETARQQTDRAGRDAAACAPEAGGRQSG